MKKSKGFTLTEVLVMIAILLIVTVAIYSAYVLSQRAYWESEMMAEITQNGRVILERITREIRQAREMVTALPATSTDATSTIEFEDGHIANLYHYIRYSQQNQNLLREEIKYYFPSSPAVYEAWNATSSETLMATTTKSEIIGEYVAGLGFWDFPVINASTTLEKGDKRINLQTKIFGRNL